MSDSSKKKKHAGIAAVFWLVLTLVILIAFLIKQDDIVRVLKETEFLIHVFGKEPEFIANYEVEIEQDSSTDTIILTEEDPLTETFDLSGDTDQDVSSNDYPSDDAQTAEVVGVPIEQAPPLADDVGDKADSTTPAVIPDDISKKPVEKAATVPATAMMNQHLYFIVINGDGTVERKETIRSVPKNTAPLTLALNALLEGPTLPDLEKGYMSLIPKNTQLLSASINDKVAIINFSDEFSYNTYGVEGYLGQLMQIVYTATAFSTIDSVQFLVDGQKNEYLGGDGVWIGTPLNRTNFIR